MVEIAKYIIENKLERIIIYDKDKLEKIAEYVGVVRRNSYIFT